MPITYPISLPTAPTARSITLRKRSVVALGVSPFSLVSQAQVSGGQQWSGVLSLPPMLRASAEPWLAALISLNGQEGSFLAGDTANLLPRGAGLSAALVQPSPAIANGGFETAGGGGADVFASWTEYIAGGTSTITRDTTEFHSGSASCRLNIDALGNEAGVITAALLTVGKRYRVSFWAKKAGGADILRLYNSALVESFVLTAGWAQYTCDFTAGATALEIYSTTAGAIIYLDDVTISPLDTYGGLVNGAAQTGQDLVTDGWLANQTGILKAGDWFQLGTGSTARLYKMLVDANSDANGAATLTFWPKLRSSPADNAPINVSSPMGRFMLAEDIEWGIDEAKVYGLSVAIVEDMRP